MPRRHGAASKSTLQQRRAQALEESRDDYLERREAIVRAAVEVFHAKGFSETTLADIAQAGNIDRASIYYYFENKAEIFRHAVVEEFLEDVVAVETIAAGPEPAPEKLRAIIRTLMANYGRHITEVIAREAEQRWPPLRPSGDEPWLEEVSAAGARFFAALRNVIAAGLKDGTLSSTLPPGVLAQSVIGLVTWTNRWYEPGRSKEPREVLASATYDLLLDGLRARPEPGS